MGATYDPRLTTDRDWVRFQVGDRGDAAQTPTSFTLSDAEIDAILLTKANRYLAAVECGQAIVAKGQGAVSKSVGNLSISYGDSPESAFRGHLQKLKEEGCRLLLKASGSHVMRML